MKKTLLTTLLAAAVLSGCSTNTQGLKKTVPGWENMEQAATDTVSANPSIIKVKLNPQSFDVQTKAMVLPPEVDTNVAVEFNNVELEKALYAIASYTGVNIVITKGDKAGQKSSGSSSSSSSTSSTPSPSPQPQPTAQRAVQSGSGTQAGESKGKKVSIRYKGKLSALLKIIAENTGAFFLYEGGAILVSENENFSVVVPAYPKLLDEIEASVTTLGAKNVAYDRLTSSLSFNADYYSYRKITDYCDKLKRNASLVTMRILLLNVTLNDSESSGIDWTQMVAGGGAQRPMTLGNSKSSSASSAAGTSSSTSTSSTTGSDFGYLGNFGASLLGNKSGGNLVVEGTSFSVSAMLSFMETYGRTSVMQNVFVESLSGTKGKIDVLTETPYVSEVSISSLSTASASASQSVKTDKAKDGVEMEISPFYNKLDGSLTIGLKISLMGVVRMLDLSAGQQIGQITQPETTRKNVDTYLRMAPTQVAVIGGLVLEKKGDSVSGLPGDSYLTKNVVKSKSKEELVIVVKPTIIEFES